MTRRVERQEFTAGCDHRSTAQCRAKFDHRGVPFHTVRAWHVWDTDTADYAPGTGPAEFPTRTAALQWIKEHTP